MSTGIKWTIIFLLTLVVNIILQWTLLMGVEMGWRITILVIADLIIWWVANKIGFYP